MCYTGTTLFAKSGINDHVDGAVIAQQIIVDADLWNGGLSGTTGWGVYNAPQSYDPGFGGLFFPSIEKDWTQENYPNGSATGVSQSRSIYSNVEAYRQAVALGQDASRFQSAATAGADYLLSNNFSDSTFGGFYWGNDFTGSNPSADRKNSYGQVHPVFALTHTYSITNDSTYLDGALSGFDAYYSHMHEGANTGGGFEGAYLGSADRDWSNASSRNLDVMTHTFETLDELYHQLPDGHARKAEFRDKAVDAGNHIMASMFQQMQGVGNEDKGFIPWHNDAQWDPVLTDPDPTKWWGNEWRFSSPGHNFEYAFLFSRAVERGLVTGAIADEWLAKSEKLMNYALEFSFGDVGNISADPDSKYMGVLYDRLDFGMGFDEGAVIIQEDSSGNPLPIQTLNWWPQAEAARSLAHWAEIRGKDEWWDEFDGVFALILDKLIDQAVGGWYYNLDPDSLFPLNKRGIADTDKGSPWKANYHATMMYTELSELAEMSAVPIPPAFYLFSSVLIGFWFSGWRRRIALAS
ncbi:MAG: AGE family epimerase/isomerase [Candidatus Sedimenticola sp. (ex Thyasira tokunagai)]